MYASKVIIWSKCT